MPNETKAEDWMTMLQTDQSDPWWSACEVLDRDVTAIIDRISAGHLTTPTHIDVARIVQFLIPIVALFGILGNALNLVVLTRKSLRCTMDHLEKSAHAGLIALAVSDALICVVYALKSAMRGRLTMLYSRHRSLFPLYFDIYHEGLFNILLVSSTWLTVVMAVGRYVAVCRPLHARGFISLRGTRSAITSVFVGSILFNLPRFWHYNPTAVPCVELLSSNVPPNAADACPACIYHVKQPGSLFQNSAFVTVYGVACSAVAILLPLPVLTVCNVCLARALRRSRKLQKQYRATMIRCRSMRSATGVSSETTSRGTSSYYRQSSTGGNQTGQSSSQHRITPTVIGLIVMFTLLVGPSEILSFFRQHIITGQRTNYDAYQTAIVITNFLLLVNFAVNFVLYCIVNAQFRRTCSALLGFCCNCRRRPPSQPGETVAIAPAAGRSADGFPPWSPVVVEMERVAGSHACHETSTPRTETLCF